MTPGILIVLGSPNDEQGRLHSIALERCACALRLHRDNPEWRLLLTGGVGAHFNTTDRPHAWYLASYLMEHGVPNEALLSFALSKNTLEDASLSKPIAMASGARAAVVITSDYHLERARWVFQREFADTEMSLLFCATTTDETRSEVDLAALRRHEREALQRLRAAEQRPQQGTRSLDTQPLAAHDSTSTFPFASRATRLS
jgi:uncharacterized SAM-binding protein YcdF (DUF218 family)